MKNKTAGKILFAVFAVALCVAAYFAADLAFFQYDDPVERATLSVVNDGEALSFTYDNDAVTLHSGDNTTVYALTYSGTAVVENTYIESLPSDFAGSFAAVQTGIREDTNGDGVTENVTRVAKTDMEYTQGYDATANSFLSDEIPFEVVYKDRESFTVYYNSEPVKNSEITVTLADGTVKIFTTDENGDITGLNLNDVRTRSIPIRSTIRLRLIRFLPHAGCPRCCLSALSFWFRRFVSPSTLSFASCSTKKRSCLSARRELWLGTREESDLYSDLSRYAG